MSPVGHGYRSTFPTPTPFHPPKCFQSYQWCSKFKEGKDRFYGLKKKKTKLDPRRPGIQPHLYYQVAKFLGMSLKFTVNLWRQEAVVGLDEI